MVVKRLKHRLSDGKRFYHGRDFTLRLAGQVFVLVSVVYVFVQKGLAPASLPLAGVFLFSAFFWRRRWEDTFVHTHLYMVFQAVVAGLVAFQDIDLSCLFLVLVGQAMAIFKPRTGLIWVAVIESVFLAVNWRHPGDALFTPESRAVVVSALMMASGLMSRNIYQTRRDRDRIQNLLTELNGAHARLQRYAGQAEWLAAATERERIARDLHDALGHRLTVSVVQLEGAHKLMAQDPRQAAGMIETVRSQLTTGLRELRQTLQALRGEEINSDSLVSSLQQTVDAFADATGIVCHCQMPEALRAPLSDDQCTAIYRTVQETLTNAQKHARALNIWVDLEASAGAVVLRVRNDGRDFDPSNGSGSGLRGMRERAELLGGDLWVTTPAEGGILVHLSLPIGEAAREAVTAQSQVLDYEVERGGG
ncbi:MAG: sensor histidine kinase [Caldilineaceae bacterium SB0668_bin_21]|nr:sensor histidine kinase [Caldilineaceae bacterium SB0668_bin_21]MYC19927.1 sensor histidine kinase [Caldilineaceae bacterium SB0662_bin_25]